MPENSENLLEKLNANSKDRRSLWKIVTSLSLVVVFIVFWNLKLTGIGIAGEAFCGKEEHTHTEQCMESIDPCTLEEHTHIESCYSDITADIETSDDWEMTLADMVRGPTIRENVVLVAQSQLGYTESTLNFQVDANGVRRGITRYGQWYGNPYGDWSAMFVSFCLHYAGVEQLPANAGPEAMRLEWESAGLYKAVAETTPEVGHLIFLHKGENEYPGANAVAIITGFDENTVTVIEGDLEGAVAETQYALNDGAIMGYGLTPEADAIIVLDDTAAIAEDCTIWLDGTDGGLIFLTGAPNTAYTAQTGSTIKLPETWTSPSKYSYKLQGWYDITNNQYYPAGGEMEVTGNAVLYADWVASTYDVGQFNAQVADTVDTSEFITMHLFDYNFLFNILSAKADITLNASGHSETWSVVTSGNVGYLDRETLDFVFIDGAPYYQNGHLAYPGNRQTHNNYPGAGIVTSGIYNEARANALFALSDSLGKKYLGTGEHLYQIMADSTNEYYGYYYYDSQRNAASYNQSQGRFYVYEYLSAPTDSIGSTYSSFLPFNSPYANTNGNTIGNFTYSGLDGEYEGVSHYQYASAYSNNGQVLANFAYGMKSDIRFYLPDDTGTDGNKDIHGNDMHFHFSGDDDMWVLIDGELVLDIGGIHGVETGDINFATGEISVQGNVTGTLDISAGEHVMSVLYLERGASGSNCAIYFNLAPRYSLDIRKEDVLTQQLLDGAQFSVYTDAAGTVPAELYTSEAAYEQGDASTNTFTVTNGVAHMWGLSPSKTYYIKETGPPAKAGYGIAQGVIRLTIDKDGQTTYHVDVVADAEGNEPSKGFTVHGVKIDETTQTVYIVVTNAPETVKETTTVQVIKKWEDSADHSSDYIQAYLTVVEADGTVRRIREVALSDENEWMYTWTNLPKHNYDTLEEVTYGIEESYESGYYSTVRKVTQISTEKVIWAEATQIIDNESYLLKHATNGYLSTTSASNGKLKWVDEATAKESPLAMWTVSIASGSGESSFTATFMNGAGQRLTFNSGYSSSSRYFYAANGTASNQTLNGTIMTNGLRIHGIRSNRAYYMYSLSTSNGRISSTTSSGSAMLLRPIERLVEEDIHEVTDWAYEITNIPLEENNETSLTVKKEWNVPVGFDSSNYQEFQITVKLLANGVDTGRTLTLTLKNNWQGAFQGLPYKSDSGEVIRYSVEENFNEKRWIVEYGDIIASGEDPPTYSVVITNTYIPGGPMLPSTGTFTGLMYTLCGWGLILGTLVYGIVIRRKRERRME